MNNDYATTYFDPSPGVNPGMGMNGFFSSESTLGGGEFVNQDTITGDLYSKLGQTSSSRPNQDVNGFIQYTYSSMPWSDKSDLYICEGTLVFANRTKHNEGLKLTPVMSVATLNSLLKMSYENLEKKKRDEGDMGGEATAFSAFMDNPNSDKMLANYHKKKIRGGALSDDESRIYRLAFSEGYRSLTKFGILRQYNFLGVAKTDGNAVSLDEIGRTQSQMPITNINVCIAKRVQVANVWGNSNEIHPGSRLYLMLEKGPMRKYYQVVPKVSFKHILPNFLNNYVWYIGYVKYPTKKNNRKSSIRDALGCPNPETVYKAIGSLEKIEINLGY